MKHTLHRHFTLSLPLVRVRLCFPATKKAGGGSAAGGGGGDIGMHSMAVEEEQQDTGQQDGYNEEDEAGDDFEDEDEEGGDVGEDDEDEEGSVVGEGQGEDGEDGREGKDDDQYAQAAPDPSGAANSLNFYDNNLFIFSQRARSARPPPVYSPHGSASAASSDVHRGVPSEDLFPLAEVVSLNYFMWQHAPRFIVLPCQ